MNIASPHLSRRPREARGLVVVVAFVCATVSAAFAQDQPDAERATAMNVYASEVAPISRTTKEIMAQPGVDKPRDEVMVRYHKNLQEPDREHLPSAPGALPEAQWPPRSEEERSSEPAPAGPQTVATVFNTVTGPTETGAFPPDTMGTIGPTQFVAFLNGRLRTFTRAGVADGVLNADPDTFFASVLTPPMAGEVVFTSDPVVKYDRISGRWFLNIIDVVLNSSSGAVTRPNRVLIAVSNAGSGTITGSTVWSFYQFQGDPNLFTDYQSFGVDASALYLGANMFTTAGAFNSTKAFVIPKAPTLTSGPMTVYTATLLATAGGAGPFSPRGVDNYDPANTGAGAIGYFIGVENSVFNALTLRRVTNPGAIGGAPSFSANITINTPLTTRFPVLVPHFGNTGGLNGRLDALDDRLFAAHLRNGRLWTAHNIGVNNTGVAGATNNRNAARWYELQNLNATPTVVQSGTLYDNNATNDANQRNYWIPSIMVSGQGHAALGCSTAGTNERINAFTTGRLVGDTLGTLRDGPGGAALAGYGTPSTTDYNPPGDPGSPSGRRWGDYSYTSLDPNDDMTMWTIQQYCNGTNTYGCRVARLLAPPPATPSSSSSNVATGQTNTNVTVTGTVVNGSGFYDPGAGFPNHITAAVTGGVTVNSVTYVSPTQVKLNLNTTGDAPGPRNVTITNPDGQFTTGNGVLTLVNAPPLQLTAAASRNTHTGVGDFSINLPLVGDSGVECRSGTAHVLVFTFSNNVGSGTATVTSGTGTAAAPVFSTNTMTVSLTGVTDVQKLTVKLSNVTDAFAQVLPDTAVQMRKLIGDSNGDGTVNSGDVTQVKGRAGQAAAAGNFRSDLNRDGAINAGDATIAKNGSGNTVPP